MPENQEKSSMQGKQTNQNNLKTKSSFIRVIITIIILGFIVVIVAACIKNILKKYILEDSSNIQNVPSAVRNYTNNTKISADGKVEFEMTPAELWKKLKEENSDVLNFLSSAEELAKLINVQIAVESLYTGKDPKNAKIDTKKLSENINSKEVQGIVKLKRAYKDTDNTSKEIYMEYKSPEEFKKIIEKYNSSGKIEDRLEAMKYFTLEKRTVRNRSSNSGNLPSSVQGLLVIGDSIAGRLRMNTSIEADGATVVYKTSASPEYFLGEQNLDYDSNIAPGTGTFDMNRDLAGITNPTGIYLILGQNSCTRGNRMENMNRLVEKLIEKYPNIPIYINSVIPKAEEENSTYNTNAKSMNQELKEYCDSYEGVYFSDILSGYKERVNEFAGDDSGTKIHPNKEGSEVIYENLKKNLQEISNNYSSNSNNNANASNSSSNVEYDPNTLHWPVPDSKNVISKFGTRDLNVDVINNGEHTGVDIGSGNNAFEGADIEAADSGIVTKAEFDSFNGNYVIIKHDSGIISYYGHMKEYIVKEGDSVNRGQLIGYVGKTGSAQGTVPHLHFQLCPSGGNIYKDYVDPMTYQYEYNNYGNNGAQRSGSTSQYIAKVARYYEVSERTINNGTTENPNYTHQMTEQEIDYKSYIRPYTMPFNYLWTMLVTTNDKKFAFELADLVYSSKLEITIRDNEVINTNIRKEDYQIKNHYETKNIYLTVSYKDDEEVVTVPRIGPYDGGQTDIYQPSESQKYNITNIRINRSDNLDIGLTLADAWCAKTIQEFEYIYEGEKLIRNIPKEVDDEVTDTVSTTNDLAHLAENVRSSIERQYKRQYGVARARVLSSNTKYEKSIVNKIITLRDFIEQSKYKNKPSETTENIDTKTGESKFTKIYKNNYKSISNIYDEWLFEFLECNEDTKDLVDLTKYLLQKASGKDYGVEEDFDTIWSKYLNALEDLEDIGDLGGKSGISGIEGQIYDNLLAKGIPPVGVAAIMGNIQHESSFKPDVVNSIGASGLCQWLGGRFNNLKKFAESQGKNWTDVDIQMDFLWKELNESKTKVRDVILSSTNESDLEYATWYWGSYFEIYDSAQYVGFEGSKNWKVEALRYKYAQHWYQEWKTHHTTGKTYARASFTEVKTQAQADARTEELNKMLNTVVHGGWNNPTGENLRSGYMQGGPFPEYWQHSYIVGHGGYSIQEFQCTWYAYGRASQYLAESGIRAEGYPTSWGNGKDYYTNNRWFKSGTTPKVHSLVSTTGSDPQYGHVAFVEGVTSDGVWFSHAGAGTKWYGVTFYSNAILANTVIGYVYLDEPLK